MQKFGEKIFTEATNAANEWQHGIIMVEPPMESALRRFQKVYRMPFGGGRKYFEIVNGDITACHGLTTYLEMIPESPGSRVHLDTWLKKNGQYADYLFKWAADYGTFMHILVGWTVTYQEIDMPQVELALMRYMRDNGMPLSQFHDYATRMGNDIRSWLQFVHEREVEVLAVEYCVLDAQMKIATPLDIICRMTFNGKRVLANINLKFRESESARDKDTKQTNLEMLLFNRMAERFGMEERIEWCGIFCPKEWKKGKPTYLLENCTGDYTMEEIKAEWSFVNSKGWLELDINKPFPIKVGGVLRYGDPVEAETGCMKDYIIQKMK